MLTILSFAVSCLAACYAYMQAKASKKQAEYARIEAAEATRSVKAAELALLHEAQKHFEDGAPRIMIGIEKPASYFEARDNDGNPLPGKRTFSRMHEGLCYIGTVVNGIVVNDSGRHIVIGGEKLSGGKTSLWDDEIPPPVRFDEYGGYLLKPGQAALFAWKASNTIADWHDFGHKAIPYTEFLFRYADDHSDRRFSRIKIELERSPCYIDYENDDRLILMEIKPGVHVTRTDAPPSSVAELRRRMRASE